MYIMHGIDLCILCSRYSMMASTKMHTLISLRTVISTFYKHHAMKKNFLPFRCYVPMLALAVCWLGCPACSDEAVEPESSVPQPETTYPDAYQDKERTQPYPKTSNELIVNPAPFLVPQAMKTGERLQYAL